MALERLDRGDRRLIVVCLLVSALSLVVGVKYFFRAFPEASIDFRVTRAGSTPLAEAFLRRLGRDPAGHRHAAVFGFDNDQKTFLERELGVAESNRLLDTTVRLWRWQHRWFRPLQKEELRVEVTTRGEVVGFTHELAENAPGANLPLAEARRRAETFLTGTMARPLGALDFLEASTQKRPHRTDHSFSWKLRGFEVKGADYRLTVEVAGARVSGYEEQLHLPDTWVRDYEKLRSRNEVTGMVDSVLLFLTLLAMLVFLALRVRRGDVRWRPAVILAGVTTVLMSGSQLNELPAQLYDYDTTVSFSGFLVGKLLLALAAGLAVGLLILVLAASAEPLYRQRLPSVLSLDSLLRVRALRSRELFIGTLVGIALTCFFFAFENVFYIVAHRLGAWSPRDVPYSDLLSTAVPWVYVLFLGFLPAISEELISRMFSIPFFERLLRSTIAAIVVAAFIWGFGHANYPNQPFWIRGLEVGLVGIVLGVAFLRFGITPVVICHFSIDALYTAFALLRSPSWYHRISGGLAAGVFLLVLVGAALAYWRRGGFLPPAVTNEAEGVPPEPPPRAIAAASDAPVEYRPLPAARVVGGLLVAAALAALALLPRPRFGDWVELRRDRAAAREAGAAFLRAHGFEVGAYRRAVRMLDRTDDTAAAYLLKVGGLGAARHVYAVLAPTPLWRVRYFVPGQMEEYVTSVDPATGSVSGFERLLLDVAKGARLPPAPARAVAERFLRSVGFDPTRAQLREQTQKDEKARRDHTLVWELPVPGGGDAKVRHEVVVQGGVVGSWLREVKVPEQWQREREQETALTVALRWLQLPLFGGLAGLAIVLLVGKIRAGDMPWRFALGVAAVAAFAVLLRSTLSLDALWFVYPTSIPAGSYLVVLLVSVLMAAVTSYVGAVVVVGLATALYPSAKSMLERNARRLYGRDAVIAGLVALGLALGLPGLWPLLGELFPAGRLIERVTWPPGVESPAPFLTALAGAVAGTLFAAALAAIVAAVISRFVRGLPARLALALLVIVAFLPRAARTLAERAVAALTLALVALVVLLVVRWFLRDNPLAWVSSAWLALGGGSAARLLAEPGGAYRIQGALLLVVVFLPVASLLVQPRSERNRQQPNPS